MRLFHSLSLRSFLSLLTLVALQLTTIADTVHLYECQSLDGAITTNVVRTLDTGLRHLSSTAPMRSGYIFTHWAISTKQSFTDRDAWGRAYDAVPVTLYEDTVLTAHYVPASRDTDGDGVADGYELYWYGDLAKTAASDTDGDGLSFSQEIAKGTNPLLAQYDIQGPILYVDGVLWQYNPLNKPAYTLRCEPEGALFATTSAIVSEGTKISTGTYGTAKGFAYWMVNGGVQRDAWGRALDSLAIAMPTNALEIVAVTATGDSDEDGIADNVEYYWYGDLDEDASGDTDGDGKTFAEELAAGTNPLLAQYDIEGPVHYADGPLWQYNPFGFQPYILKCDPEGAFFATTNCYVKQGTKVTTSAYGTTVGFAYWKLNGTEQRDAWGRALDAIAFTMPTSAVELVVAKITGDSDGDGVADNLEYYWYGDLDETGASDTDGDGKTLAEELAAGTNPLLAQSDVGGPVKYADSANVEMNLQPYEQPQGVLVDEAYTELFYSTYLGNAASSATFAEGAQIRPVVADVNGDGLWDMIVCSATSTNVYVNTGTKGNPKFDERGGFIEAALPWCDMNSTNKLADLSLDAEPVSALSATTNGTVLLVSDTEGRIWYYLSSSTSQPFNYSLQHKVWGGSYAGFAQGLMLAAVDWEDDGDLDCLCGTADGKLILLRDPKVGRPTGLTAAAGIDNVLLTWDPNEQSRIRGYKVYKATAGTEGTSPDSQSLLSLSSFVSLASPTLPTYRDTGLSPATYAYEVSALSRFYTAGNSMPMVTESPRTEPVTATIGGVSFFWNDVNVKLGEQAAVMFSIENACNFNVAGVTQTVAYAADCLKPVVVARSGLAEGVDFDWSAANGTITIVLRSGTLAAGSGTFFTLVFDTLKAGETNVGGAKVTIAETSAPFMLGDVNGDARLTTADLRLMAKLCSVAGRKYNANQLKAGDFNGDGKLSMADYNLMRKYFKGKGRL